MDNYGTHKAPRIQRWFARRPYYHVHFTPTSASWLNLVERFFGKITTQRIRRGTFRSVPALEQAIMDYLEHHNRNRGPSSDRECQPDPEEDRGTLYTNYETLH